MLTKTTIFILLLLMAFSTVVSASLQAVLAEINGTDAGTTSHGDSFPDARVDQLDSGSPVMVE